MNTQELIAEFKTGLATETLSTIVRKRITFGVSPILNHDQHYEIRAEVSEQFHIHPNEVLVVGSTKMGFSIAPHKRYKPFGDHSDIDLAIISPKLFDEIWEKAFYYRNDVGCWEYEREFKNYLFKGWIRPDKFPPGYKFETQKSWWEYFRKLTNTNKYGPYHINCGLYKSWNFFESYQQACVKLCMEDLAINK